MDLFKSLMQTLVPIIALIYIFSSIGANSTLAQIPASKKADVTTVEQLKQAITMP